MFPQWREDLKLVGIQPYPPIKWRFGSEKNDKDFMTFFENFFNVLISRFSILYEEKENYVLLCFKNLNSSRKFERFPPTALCGRRSRVSKRKFFAVRSNQEAVG
jgi:hypothetical protein